MASPYIEEAARRAGTIASWTVRTTMYGAPTRVETYRDHAEARRHYERARDSNVYAQVHITGPGYGVRP